ncbi:putative DNA polymerase alpha subunit [Cryptosporidium felis]|nr:putative DNA polymerase alpha subunit [Cryptosporidium felis]
MYSSEDGEEIIGQIQTLLGDEYENYKESFEVIHKTDPRSNPQKFLSHVEKYLGHSISKMSDKSIKGGKSLNMKRPGGPNESPPPNSSKRVLGIKSFSGSLSEFRSEEFVNSKQKAFGKVKVDSIFNESLPRRKGCLTDKSRTKFYLEKTSEGQEDSLWLDSDLDSYSIEIDRRIQSLVDEIINNCSDLWIDNQGNKYPIIPVGETRRQAVVVLGAIGCDNEGRLNEQSIQLLGTRASSSGNTSQLKLDSLRGGDVALYPGQVVAILGNTEIDEFGQSCLFAKEIIGGLPPRPPETYLRDFKAIPEFYAKKEESHQDRHPVQCLIFSGPYTRDNRDLDYDFLDEVLDFANIEKPHVLILLGPFIDTRNESVNRGDIFDFDSNSFLTFEELFYKVIYGKIEGFAKKNEKVRILLIPSEYDAAHPFPLPQPGLNESFFPNKSTGTPKNISFLSNPCELYINDLKISVTSSDVVTPILNSSVTTSRSLPLEVVLSQFLYQRTLYPCFPVQHPINPKLLPKLILSGELPHILVTPCEGAGPFVKPVLGRIFVNPRGENESPSKGGVALYLHPPSEAQIQQESSKTGSNQGSDEDRKVSMLIEDRVCADKVEFSRD